ncbi:hypothetical protein KFZ58_18745 [Virgibacillus sp. NKC19-16]|uniref:hypothetical protein n=1 Tax=Virgibacillus salidurans TaxID=2831673 RepID=UPI001F206019|nr:hypothetical protein [Virgibacillus sp. NKC19-16]UJL46353.1 hypothetical protein KFZ58_18745 [Virgibacillus sp. NKC19-16]
MKLNPLDIRLDFTNPRLSLFNFNNEEEVIRHLIQYENLYSLIDSFVIHGYNTLGERLILLEENKNYTVLEGNRRIAALKSMFLYQNLLKASYRKKVSTLKLENFLIDGDVIKNREEADYKIAAKHIASIQDWKSIDKYVYYENMFNRLRKQMNTAHSISYIKDTTPDKESEIKKSIRFYKFLLSIHAQVKFKDSTLKPLTLLNNDVITSRVYPSIRKTLNLKENSDFELVPKEGKEEVYKSILLAIGSAAWSTNNEMRLNTRTFSVQKDWERILNEDQLIPGLKLIIDEYLSEPQSPNIMPTNGERNSVSRNDNVNSLKNSGHKSIQGTNTNEPKVNQENKYRLFVIKDKNVVQKPKNGILFNLMDAVCLYDETSSEITKKSSIYNNIKFTTQASDDILIKESYVLENSKPKLYKVNASYEKQIVTFDLIIEPKQSNPRPQQDFLFDDEWRIRMVSKLDEKIDYHKIRDVIFSLSFYRNLSKIKVHDVLIVSFLTRALLEYLSKAYIDRYPELKQKIDGPDNLGNKIKIVSEDMYNKNHSSFNLEQKKSIKNQDDLELINGIVHDYKTTLTNQDFIRIFRKYKPFMESIINML